MAACPECGNESDLCACIAHNSLLDFLDTFRSASSPSSEPVVAADRPAVPRYEPKHEWPPADPDPDPDAAPGVLAPPARDWAPPARDWAPPAGDWAPPAYQALPTYQPPAYQPPAAFPPPAFPPPPGYDPYGAGSFGRPPSSGFGAGKSTGWRWGMTALASVAAVMVIASVAVLTFGSRRSATAQTIVAGALNRSFGQRTADVKFTMTADESGQSVSASGTGTIDFADRSIDLNMVMAPMNMHLEAVFIAGTVYESIPGISSVEPGKSWVSLDLSGLGVPAGTGGSPSFSTNPTESLQLLAQKGAQVVKMGASSVDGVAVQGYTVSYPADAWNALRANQSLPADVRNALANITMTSQVYITKSDQVARVEVAITTATGPSINETLDFSNYGAGAAIAAPDGSKVVPFQQFMSDAQAQSTSPGSAVETQPATSASECVEPIPAGASPQAAAYLTAVNQDYGPWTKVSSLMVHDTVSLYNTQILALQIGVDTQFVHQLQAIDFTGPAAAPATELKSIVTNYITALNNATADLKANTDDPTVDNALNTLGEQRQSASAALRAALNLPPSRCVLVRP